MYLLETLRAPHRARARTPTRAREENFPVALRALPEELRGHLLAVYRYARHVDDLGDEVAGDRIAALRGVESDVRRLYDGLAVDDPVVAALRPTVRECAVPREPLLRLVRANLQDQSVATYQSFQDLLAYCDLSANPVGEIVLHVFGQATPERISLSDRICTGLQLVEHWQDVAEDRGKGRVYLPQEDLRRFEVSESDLDAPVAAPGLRALLAFETARAEAVLRAGEPLVRMLRGWARLAVSGYLAGGLATAAALRRAGHDPLSSTPRARTAEVARAWAGVAVRTTSRPAGRRSS